jgi:hypothetical protein
MVDYRLNIIIFENDQKRAKSLLLLLSDVFTILVSVLSVTVNVSV